MFLVSLCRLEAVGGSTVPFALGHGHGQMGEYEGEGLGAVDGGGLSHQGLGLQGARDSLGCVLGS